MAFIRICYLAMLLTCVSLGRSFAQTIYYPANSSQLLRATAADLSDLLRRSAADTTIRFELQVYTNTMPITGIVLVYDSTITDNQLCKVESNGSSRLVFTAGEDNGLVFGIYQYLDELGFKFYQPGTIWELIPRLSSFYKALNKNYNTAYRYKSWFISGGHRTWLMDKSTAYNWENYIGENGHNWALYQRRNGMLGANRFAGHRGDVLTGTYMATIQSNACYVASFNGSRQATTSSVPDVNNEAAKNLWATTIQQKFTTSNTNILNNRALYVNQYRSINYNSQYIGIEVPDGPRWGNSKDSIGCSTAPYASASDQSITLANYTVQQIKSAYPARRFQLYGYAGHANVPSAGVHIDPSIDIQVVPTAFQNETSAKGLLYRWYNRHPFISEYHYMNIPQWSGETPMMYLSELKQITERLREKRSQGITWEASPAKFASLPFLRAANENMIKNISIDSSLKQFCKDMFGPAADPVNRLLHEWSSDGAVTMGYYTKDNKYKLPRYVQLLQEAVQRAAGSGDLVYRRLNELKAYLHYMVLYYDWFSGNGTLQEKEPQAAALCTYLARINKLQLVNSYYLITGIAARFGSSSSFFAKYNIQTGSAYLNGSLPLITSQEIEENYHRDVTEVGTLISTYNLQSDRQVSEWVRTSNFTPAEKIAVTLGPSATNRFLFSIYAPAAGNFTIKCGALPGGDQRSSVNFTVDNMAAALGVIMDTTINAAGLVGHFNITLPVAGFYTLAVSTKYASTLNLDITTNGNAFYKNTAFTHRYAEKYTASMSSLPGFFYVPAGLQRVYFSVNNAYQPNSGYLTTAQVSNEFLLRDNFGVRVEPVAASGEDKSLFYINIPPGQGGTFWQVSKMGQYFFCLANISNVLWHGSRKTCAPASININVVKIGGECHTTLSTSYAGSNLKWLITDGGTTLSYDVLPEVVLPASISPAAIVTLFTANNCTVTKILSQEPGYLAQREACASGAPLLQTPIVNPVVFPNPSGGKFTVQMSSLTLPEVISISDVSGRTVRIYRNTTALDLTVLAAGIYTYKITADGKTYSGQIVKRN